ncbi:MAG: hypothetical protein HY738_07815 [Bacteroidia bacterium]|nr:hypothetical protein [Bacteroidia bacterium]
MLIANPIYDVVFKRLMEDKRIAKFFIETLIEEEVADVQIKPQEFTFFKDLEQPGNNEKLEKIKEHIASLMSLAVYRADFIANIKTKDNEYKKVLIEIQKAKNPIDLMRFRNYLAEQYKKEDEIETISGKEKVVLPIITIYLLGFPLPEIESAAIKVNRQYFDLITRQLINRKSDFIERLTHDCYVVQMSKIEGRLKTRLEQLLSIFEQNYFIDEKGITKEYNYEVENEIINLIISILHKAGSDPKERQEIEKEQEFYRILELSTREAFEKAKELEKIIVEMGKKLDKKDKLLEDKDKLIEDLTRKLNKK